MTQARDADQKEDFWAYVDGLDAKAATPILRRMAGG